MIAFHAHSGLRYLALLVGVAVLGYGAWRLAGRRGHDSTLYNLAGTYRLLMDVTFLMGVAVLFARRSALGIGPHIVVMLFATLVAHLVPAVMRRRPPEERSVMPYLVATAVSVGLVLVGTAMLGRPVLG
jgi:hypothetical protein